MKYIIFILAILCVSSSVSVAHAQEIGGGVNVPGNWWLGEGLKQGDQFSYKLCHVVYKECQFFEIDLWIKGEVQTGTEQKWLAKAVVYDGHKIIKGDIEFGQITAEPTGGSTELVTYRTAFASSVSWLSSFATSYGDKGPKAFAIPSWGKIANIGGQQVKPITVESVTVPAGTFEESIKIGWRTGGANSAIWIVDEFPFPIKASTWTHVATGIPPQEYKFTLLEYKENVSSDPFADIAGTVASQETLGCPNLDNLEFATLKAPTVGFNYITEILYKAEEPKQGCDMEWLIKFKNKYNESEFLNQVQYDIVVVDDLASLSLSRSLASDDNKNFLYSPSGLAERTLVVREPAGENNYAVIIYGLAPEFVVPDNTKTPIDYVIVPITIKPNDSDDTTIPDDSKPKIPSWVRSNAGLWASQTIDDDTFIRGLQYLIEKGIIAIADTTQQQSGDGNIPDWVRNNAELWANQTIDDDTFLVGIKYLIENGIIVISS